MNSTLHRIEARMNILIAMTAGLYLILLPGAWLLVRMADKLGALGL